MPSKGKVSLKYSIPARPDTLVQLQKIMQDNDPDIDLIITTLKQDAGLYSIILATVNSPCFALKKPVTSISNAIVYLGLGRLFSLVKLSILKSSLSKGQKLDRFWDTASEVAGISHSLIKNHTNLDPDSGYSLGMLHDCGIPILMQASSDYLELLQQAHGKHPKYLIEQEESIYGVNHYTVGGKLANNWKMPAEVYKAILLQAKYPEVLIKYRSKADDTLMHLAILSIAKDISKTYRHYWRLEKDEELNPELLTSLEYVGICDYDYLDMKEEYMSSLNEE